LIAEACSSAPEGRQHWTLSLLAERVVQLKLADSYSYEAVRRVLKKQTQAVVKRAMVHPGSLSRVCRLHGGCAGTLCRAI